MLKVYSLALVTLSALAGLTGCAGHRELALEPTPYDNHLVSVGVMFADLPPPVQRAIRAEVGGAEIADVTRRGVANQAVYRVRMVRRAMYPPLYVAADGSVLNPDLSVAIGAPVDQFDTLTGAATSKQDLEKFLPPQVLTAVQNRAPITDVTHVSRQPWGDRSLYVITFRDAQAHPTMYVTSEGTILSDKPK